MIARRACHPFLVLTLSTFASLVASVSAEAAPPAPASTAPPSRAECISAADDGQKLRDDGKLASARDKFVLCAQKSCPAVVAKACASWRDDADRDMPSATFRILGEDGAEIIDAQITLDDAAASQPLAARALPLDPGEHKVHVARADGKSVDEKFLLRPGEKNRMVDVKFVSATPPSPTAPPSPTSKPIVVAPDSGFKVPLLGWVGLGVGVAGATTMTIFAVLASNDASSERALGCAPNCPSSDKSGIDTKLAVANVGMIVGIVGLGTAVVTTILANTGKPAKTTGMTIDASPRGVWVSGTF